MTCKCTWHNLRHIAILTAEFHAGLRLASSRQLLSNHKHNRTPSVSEKNCASVIFANNSVKHWPILILGMQPHKKLDIDGCSYVHLTFMLSLHYFVRCAGHSLIIQKNGFILGYTCISSVIVLRWYLLQMTQLTKSLRQLGSQKLLRTFRRKTWRKEDMTTWFQTLTNTKLRKAFQTVGNMILKWIQ